MKSRLAHVVHPADHEPVVDERALQRLQDSFVEAFRQPGIANLGQSVLVGERVEVVQGAVVQRRGFPRMAEGLGFDAVEERRRNALGDRDVLFHQVTRHQGTGRPNSAADIQERNVLQVTMHFMVIDDGIERHFIGQMVPARVGLAVHHDRGFRFRPAQLLDRNQLDVENVHHRPVFGPVDGAVAGQAGRFAQADFHQMGQPEHAAEAVGILVDVRHKRNAAGLLQAAEKPIRTAGGCGQDPTAHLGFGAGTRHRRRSSDGCEGR